ncbi:hypothetical protein X777_01467 [Ooceraea biroi]|uniref:Uncharacterized protein n=1 Tax=Ooceraea biroi TaxID=2015173 RepID=A0A026WR00_OOCBI|nr:hypothetical protein X777_01467 [Ooceraea biroi]
MAGAYVKGDLDFPPSLICTRIGPRQPFSLIMHFSPSSEYRTLLSRGSRN